ncbi:MAG: molybdopterin molybdotransferase MoeA, partial [Candidatus Eremiobacteraeota bacterium]|nr:molybdopterin molybdotransferase MoeA [Candidatus Eremiobacteraeota bacterium]
MTVHDAVTFEDAQRRIAEACAALETHVLSLTAAAGAVLAKTLVAEEDLIPFARSAMDGYAVIAAQTHVERRFPVGARAYAERGTPLRHEPGTATAVATGAPVPLGADAVVPFEDVVARDGSIELLRGVAAGAHIFPPGEDARRGDLLARAGDVLGPATLGLLAAAGHATVEVVRRPRVTLLTSGEEIVDVSAAPGFGEIRNSNATSVGAALAAFGAEVVQRVHVGDDRVGLAAALTRAAVASDLIVTTGGASVGERDFVKPVLDELGATFAFRSVAMRPGRPTAFARLGETRVAALSGNPAAAAVALHELVRAAVYALAGRRECRLPRVSARLRGGLHGKGERTYFAFAALHVDAEGRLEATPLSNQCSALTRTSVDASGFAVVPPARGNVADGETIE